VLSVQNPVRLDDGSEPQPDVTILRPRGDDYETATPRATDVLLIIEVADASLNEDRSIKAPLYAESGIIEYWIVNLIDRVVEVCRQPENGRYVQTFPVDAGGVLDIVTLPGISFSTVELLRPGAS
jgi:Uma2 family endonuclease